MVSSEDERGDYVIPYVCFAIKPRCTEIIGTNVSGRLKYEDQPSSIRIQFYLLADICTPNAVSTKEADY